MREMWDATTNSARLDSHGASDDVDLHWECGFDAYAGLMRRIYKVILKDYRSEEADDSILDDWESDTKGSGLPLTQEQFADALFELADHWTAGIGAWEYADFLRKLLNAITEPAAGAGEGGNGSARVFRMASQVAYDAEMFGGGGGGAEEEREKEEQATGGGGQEQPQPSAAMMPHASGLRPRSPLARVGSAGSVGEATGHACSNSSGSSSRASSPTHAGHQHHHHRGRSKSKGHRSHHSRSPSPPTGGVGTSSSHHGSHHSSRSRSRSNSPVHHQSASTAHGGIGSGTAQNNKHAAPPTRGGVGFGSSYKPKPHHRSYRQLTQRRIKHSQEVHAAARMLQSRVRGRIARKQSKERAHAVELMQKDARRKLAFNVAQRRRAAQITAQRSTIPSGPLLCTLHWETVVHGLDGGASNVKHPLSRQKLLPPPPQRFVMQTPQGRTHKVKATYWTHAVCSEGPIAGSSRPSTSNGILPQQSRGAINGSPRKYYDGVVGVSKPPPADSPRMNNIVTRGRAATPLIAITSTEGSASLWPGSGSSKTRNGPPSEEKSADEVEAVIRHPAKPLLRREPRRRFDGRQRLDDETASSIIITSARQQHRKRRRSRARRRLHAWQCLCTTLHPRRHPPYSSPS